MDTHHLIRVVRERRRLLLFGALAAVALAIFAYARPAIGDNGIPTLEPRGAETWLSEEILFISQPGFPAGRGVPQYRASNPERGTPAIPVDDQTRLSNLAPVYARLAVGDAVRERVRANGGLAEDVDLEAEPITYATTQFAFPQVLPMVRLFTTADSKARATAIVERFSGAFRTYIAAQQKAAGIAERDRVQVRVLKKAVPRDATLIAGRSKVAPILVFFAVLALVVGLALVLDNLKQARRRELLVENFEAEDELPAVTTAAFAGAQGHEGAASVRARRRLPDR
jgi:hypothetical protein